LPSGVAKLNVSDVKFSSNTFSFGACGIGLPETGLYEFKVSDGKDGNGDDKSHISRNERNPISDIECKKQWYGYAKAYFGKSLGKLVPFGGPLLGRKMVLKPVPAKLPVKFERTPRGAWAGGGDGEVTMG
jgi:hypothetical protein